MWINNFLSELKRKWLTEKFDLPETSDELVSILKSQ